jgi:formiminoglutamase
MQNFKFYDKKDILFFTNLRKFETKLGEVVDFVTDTNKWKAEIENSAADFVLFGIAEDIGVLANLGSGGTNTCWNPFLNSFLNTQSNDFLEGTEILLLGHFEFENEKNAIIKNSTTKEERVDAFRHYVNEIDEQVANLVKIITSMGKFPIAIGGGHNNAYGMLKGAAKGLHKINAIPLAQLNCINVDAHTDYRPTEGRHSGNAFRYAEEDGFLVKYCTIGVQENYIQQNVWNDIVNNPFTDLITYEDIFIHEKRNFIQAVAHATSFTDDSFVGIELDLDSIENTATSAVTPCGITALDARRYLNFVAHDAKCAYLHICEGKVNGTETTGKLISYLVSDFVKSYLDYKLNSNE